MCCFLIPLGQFFTIKFNPANSFSFHFIYRCSNCHLYSNGNYANILYTCSMLILSFDYFRLHQNLVFIPQHAILSHFTADYHIIPHCCKVLNNHNNYYYYQDPFLAKVEGCNKHGPTTQKMVRASWGINECEGDIGRVSIWKEMGKIIEDLFI